ncbi:MAG: substrate-binding domain-containing protein [Candidatus Thermoplasmatota archaeon]
MRKNTKGEIPAIWAAVVIIVLVVVGAAAYFVMSPGSPAKAKPELIQTGSSTVLPLAIAWAEEYDGATIIVSGGGSSHGLNALLNKEADLADASRLLKGSDYEKVGGDPALVNPDGTASGPAPSGVWPVKWVVAYDVLVVVVNNKNTWATQLNYDQLYQIFTADSPAVYWDEVSGLTGAPHERIEIYAPDAASGTYDFFFEEIIPHWGKDDQVTDTRLDSGDGVYHPSADDNVILDAIMKNEYAIGYFGFAYYKENTGSIKAAWLAEAGTDYEEPSLANVEDYPMARPLHIYTDGVPEPGTPVNDYLRYVLSEEGQSLVPEVGYVRLSFVDSGLVTSQLDKLQDNS